jgi:hypothetical protein
MESGDLRNSENENTVNDAIDTSTERIELDRSSPRLWESNANTSIERHQSTKRPMIECP